MRRIVATDADGRLRPLPAPVKNAWVHLEAPTPEELEATARETRVPEAVLASVLDPDERPRAERRGEAAVVVVHVPVPAGEEDVPREDGPLFRLRPLAIVHAPDHLITVAGGPVPLLEPFLTGAVGGFGSHMKTRITLLVLAAVAEAFLQAVRAVQKEVEAAERDLARAYANRELYRLFAASETFIFLETSLAEMRAALRKIAAGDVIRLYPDDGDLLEDVAIDLEQAYGAVEVHHRKLVNVMDAYGNVIQINVNAVLKLLTAVTVLLSVPILIASALSMNVPFFLFDRPDGFIDALMLIVGATATVAAVFWRLRFF